MCLSLNQIIALLSWWRAGHLLPALPSPAPIHVFTPLIMQQLNIFEQNLVSHNDKQSGSN